MPREMPSMSCSALARARLEVEVVVRDRGRRLDPARGVARRLAAQLARVIGVVKRAGDGALLDQRGAAARRAFAVEGRGRIPARPQAVVDQGEVLGEQLLSLLSGQHAAALVDLLRREAARREIPPDPPSRLAANTAGQRIVGAAPAPSSSDGIAGPPGGRSSRCQDRRASARSRTRTPIWLSPSCSALHVRWAVNSVLSVRQVLAFPSRGDGVLTHDSAIELSRTLGDPGIRALAPRFESVGHRDFVRGRDREASGVVSVVQGKIRILTLTEGHEVNELVLRHDFGDLQRALDGLQHGLALKRGREAEAESPILDDADGKADVLRAREGLDLLVFHLDLRRALPLEVELEAVGFKLFQTTGGFSQAIGDGSAHGHHANFTA